MQSRTIIGKTTLRSLSSHGNLAFGSIFGSRTLIHVSNKYIASSSEMFKISWRERADLRAFLSFVFAQYKIRMSQKSWMIQPIPKSMAKQELPYQQFRVCIFTFYC